jgi:hypothetical protein
MNKTYKMIKAKERKILIGGKWKETVQRINNDDKKRREWQQHGILHVVSLSRLVS